MTRSYMGGLVQEDGVKDVVHRHTRSPGRWRPLTRKHSPRLSPGPYASPMGLSKLQQQLKKKEAERKAARCGCPQPRDSGRRVLTLFFSGKATAVSAASKAKSQADAQAFVCAVCRTAFPVNVRSDALEQHAVNKHPKLPVSQAWPQLEEMKAKEAAKV